MGTKAGNGLFYSTGWVALMLGVLLGVADCSMKEKAYAADTVSSFTVGALLPLTGTWVTHGQSCADTLTVAHEVIRSQLLEGAVNLDISIMDTASEPDKALSHLQTMHGQGIRVVIGPMSSEEAAHVLDYANSNNMILISPSATASELDKPDNLLRLPPSDIHQADALLLLMQKNALSTLAVLHIDDLYGRGLYGLLAQKAHAHGISLLPSIPLSRHEPNIDKAITDVEARLADMPPSSTALLLIDSDERAESLIQGISGGSILRKFKWYVSESITGSNRLQRKTASY